MSTTTTAASTTPDAPIPALDALTRALGSAPVTETFRDNLRVFVPAESLIAALTALRDECGFTWLIEIGGTDYLGYPQRDPARPRFEVHYILRNLDANTVFILKTGANDSDPTLPSAVPLWLGADWMEREIFDMFGIRFDGHPDLRRILMPDEFVSFPLRKDYPLRGRGERHNFPRITREQS